MNHKFLRLNGLLNTKSHMYQPILEEKRVK